MRFERTHDLRLVRHILTDPGIWSAIGDDNAPEVRHFRANPDGRIWYVLAIAGTRVAGLFMFVPQSAVCWEAHVSMLPETSGRVKHQAGKEILPWLWEQSSCRRIVASVPVLNRPAVMFGLRSMGLRKFGVNEQSFLKHGRMWDQVLMGISRPGGNVTICQVS